MKRNRSFQLILALLALSVSFSISARAETLDFPAMRVFSCNLKKITHPTNPTPEIESKAPTSLNFFVGKDSLAAFGELQPNTKINGFTILQANVREFEDLQIAVPFEATFSADLNIVGTIDKKFNSQVFHFEISSPADPYAEFVFKLKDTEIEADYGCKGY